MMSEPREVAIRVHRLHKCYNDISALAGVSLEVRTGEILGVLGPNGAGKTTLIEILEGMRIADGGSATVLDVDVSQPSQMKSIRRQIGISMQKTALPQLLTVAEIVGLYSVIHPKGQSTDEIVSYVGLEEKINSQTRHLSGGQLQRLALALALVGNPALLFLDEPTSELDPQARRMLWDLILKQQSRLQRTVILTTHQMEEAQRLCDRVAILDHGKVLAFGTPSGLIDTYCPGHTIRFTTEGTAALHVLANAVLTENADHPSQPKIEIRTDRLEATLERLLVARQNGKCVVEDLRVERLTLEDVFLNLTGRRIRD